MTAVLDAWALVAYLKAEPAAKRVRSVIDSGRATACEVNLGETLYTVGRTYGERRAAEMVRELRRLVIPEQPDWQLTLDAARLKLGHSISYADAYAVATAQRHDLPLWTGDPEILALDAVVDSVDLRS